MLRLNVDGPVSCLWCREKQASCWLCGNNHGGSYGLHWGICLAQHLTRNHVHYATQHDSLDRLLLAIERAEALWSHVPGPHDWLEAAHARVLVLRGIEHAPAHRAVPISEDLRNGLPKLSEPLALTGGRWVLVKGVQRWVQDGAA